MVPSFLKILILIYFSCPVTHTAGPPFNPVTDPSSFIHLAHAEHASAPSLNFGDMRNDDLSLDHLQPSLRSDVMPGSPTPQVSGNHEGRSGCRHGTEAP